MCRETEGCGKRTGEEAGTHRDNNTDGLHRQNGDHHRSGGRNDHLGGSDRANRHDTGREGSDRANHAQEDHRTGGNVQNADQGGGETGDTGHETGDTGSETGDTGREQHTGAKIVLLSLYT